MGDLEKKFADLGKFTEREVHFNRNPLQHVDPRKVFQR